MHDGGGKHQENDEGFHDAKYPLTWWGASNFYEPSAALPIMALCTAMA
jgi:hypothetical protein